MTFPTPEELAQKYSLKKTLGYYTGVCPVCGYPNGFKAEWKNGKSIVHCFSCGDRQALVAAILGNASPAPTRSTGPTDNTDRTAAALRLWDAAHPADGSWVDAYLAGRHTPRPPGAPLRFLPFAKHPCGQRFPAMVALLQDLAGRPVAIHRTFLAHGGAGKAKVDPVRMTLGPVRGAAVRLYPAASRLVVGEGIETSLAAGLLMRTPAWAAISAGNLAETMLLPPEVQEVIIAVDNDAPGQAAARKAAARFRAEGRQVQLAIPKKPGTDFNDLLRERGQA